jgi:hypothetical protein
MKKIELTTAITSEAEPMVRAVAEAIFTAYRQFLEVEWESESSREGYPIDPDYAERDVAERLPPEIARYMPKKP